MAAPSTAAFAVSADAVSPASCCGVRDDVKAMRLPSGDQTGPLAPVSSEVSGHASPPSASGRIQIWPRPSSRLVVKAMLRPSGDQTGEPRLALEVHVTRRGAPEPSVAAIQRSRW